MSTAKISRRYAVALFDLIQEGVDVRPALLEAAAFSSNSEASAILKSPAYPNKVKCAMLKAAISGSGSDEVFRLVELLAERAKLVLLAEIAAQVLDMIAQAESSVDAGVTSAVKMSVAVQRALAESLTAAVGKKVNIVANTDTSILGGVIIRIGDRKIDCSVKSRLDALKRSIVG
ncbi:MAG: ATP synthase F1 subunit delta [Mariprofundaceae bacterium]|nr:ATP synthase F1 subunit delta [Mariprofundaceae bacterium]